MHTASHRVHHQRERIDVGAFQLVQPAPLEDELRELVGERQLLEHFRGRRERSRLACFLRDRHCELLEQDASELLRRVDVEFLLRELVDPRRVLTRAAPPDVATATRAMAVDEHPCALDVGEHGHERHLEVPVNRLQLLADDQRCQLARQLPREVRALGGELRTVSGDRFWKDTALAPFPRMSSSLCAR